MAEFEYPFRDEDFIDKLLKDHPELEQWRDVFNDYAQTSTARDDDLESYLGQQTFAPSIGVTKATVSATSPTTISFDGISFQSTDQFTWDSGSPTLVTVGASGVVTVSADATFAISAAGSYRKIAVVVNGISTPVGQTGPTTGGVVPVALSCTKTIPVIAGDTFRLDCAHDTGGSLSITNASLSLIYAGVVG